MNRGTPAIQQDIIDKLKDRAIDPQAVVAIVSQTSTEVTVVGDVNTPGKISINPAGDRVLDAISRAGGIRNPGYEEFVTLQRHGLNGTVYFINLVKDPRENVFVEPGDTLYVYQYQRAFMAFGATGASGQFKFLQENVTLSDAVGKAGGLLDSRAEPGQVFVYRIEKRSTLEKMGVDISNFASGSARTFRRFSASISAILRASSRRDVSRCGITTSSMWITPIRSRSPSSSSCSRRSPARRRAVARRRDHQGSILYLQNQLRDDERNRQLPVTMSAVVYAMRVVECKCVL